MSTSAHRIAVLALASLTAALCPAAASARTVYSQSKATFKATYAGTYSVERFAETKPVGTACYSRRGSSDTKRTVTMAASGRLHVERIRVASNGHAYRLEFTFAPAKRRLPTSTRIVDSEQSPGYENYLCRSSSSSDPDGWYPDYNDRPVSTNKTCNLSASFGMGLTGSRLGVGPFTNSSRCGISSGNPKPYETTKLHLMAKVSRAQLFSRRALTLGATDSKVTDTKEPASGDPYESSTRTTVSGTWTVKLRRLTAWRTKNTYFP